MKKVLLFALCAVTAMWAIGLAPNLVLHPGAASTNELQFLEIHREKRL
jgi:hypothetical protein